MTIETDVYPDVYKTPSTDIFQDYAKYQGTDNDKLDMIYATLETLIEVMDRNKVYQKSAEWDEEGVKLVNGKVVFPNGYEKVIDEIIKENQLGTLVLPESLGGLELTGVQFAPIIELIARYDAAMGMTAMSGLGIMNILKQFYKPEFEEILVGFSTGENTGYAAFTEPQAGSNLRNIKSTSVLDGDEYVLNGTKIFITNGGYANYGIFLANNIVNGKKEGTNVFLVGDYEGITAVRLEHKSGIRTSPTAELLFEDVRVPKEHLIGEVGTGYEKVIERLLGMRVSVSFQALGNCKRAYELAEVYSNTREQFGKTIGTFPAIRRKLKQMRLQIPRMEEWAYAGAYALDWATEKTDSMGVQIVNSNRDKLVNSIQEILRHEDLIHYYVSGGKLYNGEISNYFMYDAQQIFGGNGFISETEINKITRDVRILPVFDGTSEIHSWVIERSLKYLEGMPEFVKISSLWDDKTIYEDYVNSKFPSLNDKL
ncbi:MAG: acyl-CoA/acyl-ACP dehydrogenase [Candidatus Heimdallarchaeota archaeon]|nr:acyl-CoA/acyl-ACP dehydrogenase [Candidatus Heimdallarchaeota archaeon]